MCWCCVCITASECVRVCSPEKTNRRHPQRWRRGGSKGEEGKVGEMWLLGERDAERARDVERERERRGEVFGFLAGN